MWNTTGNPAEMTCRAPFIGLALWWGLATTALCAPLSLALPAGVELLRQQDQGAATMLLPLGPAQADVVPTQALEGRIWRRSWRVLGEQTTLDVFAPLRAGLQEAGFHVEYSCVARLCGGFAFRFGIDVIPAPDMRVRLSDFEFLTARRAADEAAIAVLVSRSGGAVYIQAIERHALNTPAPPQIIAPEVEPPQEEAEPEAVDVTTPIPTPASVAGAPVTLRAALVQQGHAVLEGLEFASGSSRLQEDSAASLKELADLLAAEPDWRVMIVGHTDNVGGLQGNMTLSRRRAASVRSVLERDFDLPRARLEVAGAGFMAPLTENVSGNGRDINRRVEVVLLSP